MIERLSYRLVKIRDTQSLLLCDKPGKRWYAITLFYIITLDKQYFCVIILKIK